jgi:hypothetical protein
MHSLIHEFRVGDLIKKEKRIYSSVLERRTCGERKNIETQEHSKRLTQDT